jgi:hypothetical protein
MHICMCMHIYTKSYLVSYKKKHTHTHTYTQGKPKTLTWAFLMVLSDHALPVVGGKLADVQTNGGVTKTSGTL